jgi:ATP-dependent protease Clp ATPase subunit
MGNNILLFPHLTEFMVRTHFSNKAVAEEAKKEAVAKPPPVLAPQALFGKLKEYIVSNDAACRLLSVRGALHLNRRELLRNGTEAGHNECILLIGPSGTGKTYIAETFGRLCGLPFASLSASNFTSTGYVGLDPDDALKALIRSAGDLKNPQSLEKARYGVLFMDEWDKRRANNGSGVDVAGSAVQYEWLKLISGTKLVLGARRYERDEQQIEFNSNGTFFCFAGAFSGLDGIIGRLGREQSGIGFGGNLTPTRAPMLYDALAEFGLVPEFLNRVTAVIGMKPLDAGDIAQIAVSPHGTISAYNQILAPQGISISVDPAGLKELAEFCVDAKLYARGIVLVISAIVEDIVFNDIKGDHVISVEPVREAIERIAHREGTEGTGS